MRIELENLERGRGSFVRTYAVDELTFDEPDLQLLAPVSVEGRIRRQDGEVELRGKLATKVAVACDRCLKSVELPVEVAFKERFVPAVAWRGEEQHELAQEDLDLSVFDGEAIDIDELVKEELLLAVPDHVLCSEGCKGNCGVCGANKNSVECGCESRGIDPRWAGLKKLVNSK